MAEGIEFRCECCSEDFDDYCHKSCRKLMCAKHIMECRCDEEGSGIPLLRVVEEETNDDDDSDLEFAPLPLSSVSASIS
jgi:uncharacterized protein YqkB